MVLTIFRQSENATAYCRWLPVKGSANSPRPSSAPCFLHTRASVIWPTSSACRNTFTEPLHFNRILLSVSEYSRVKMENVVNAINCIRGNVYRVNVVRSSPMSFILVNSPVAAPASFIFYMYIGNMSSMLRLLVLRRPLAPNSLPILTYPLSSVPCHHLKSQTRDGTRQGRRRGPSSRRDPDGPSA